MEEIRNQRGLAYAVDSYFAAGKYPGAVQVMLQTKNASAQEAITLAQSQMERMRTTMVSDSEFQEAKQYLMGNFPYLMGNFPLRLETQAKLAQFLSQVEYYGLGLEYPQRYPALIEAVTREDVLRVAQAYLRPDHRIIVVVANLRKLACSNPLYKEKAVSNQSVVGVYETMAEAEEAVRTLYDEGFPIKHVSIVTQNLASEKGMHGFITAESDMIKRITLSGAWVGSLFSLQVGAAFLWAPGFGPLVVAGRLAALLLAGTEGALLGAATGSLLGALVNWGIAEEHILDYQQQVQSGKYVLIAYGAKAEVAQAHAILRGTKAGKLSVYASVSV